MDLKEDLLRGIYAYGFEKPSAIQQRAIKPILLKHDVIAQAQSGKNFFFLHLFVCFAFFFPKKCLFFVLRRVGGGIHQMKG